MKAKEPRIDLIKRVISQTYVWDVFLISIIVHIEENLARNCKTMADLHIVRVTVISEHLGKWHKQQERKRKKIHNESKVDRKRGRLRSRGPAVAEGG